MPEEAAPIRTDLPGKVTVIVMLRTSKNQFVKGNRMRSFSVSGSTVTEVADAIAPAIARVRKKTRAARSLPHGTSQASPEARVDNGALSRKKGKNRGEQTGR